MKLLPRNATSAGDFSFDVLNVATEGTLRIHRTTATAARQTLPNRFPIRFSGELLQPDAEFILRVTDPLGRRNETAPIIAP